ncbi:MAG: hypothetical protein M1834_007521 [Cirrosporium novae-zelandiae]|nr:MAG: hypothetical protein M1834_007521 [Cirrosporium novae-zelandiae]
MDQQMKPVCQIVTPIGMLGYGLDEHETNAAIEELLPNHAPTALILDSGSTDGGPSKLALGSSSLPRASFQRDLRKLLTSAHKYKIPLLISSAGGDGSNAHTENIIQIVREIAEEPENSSYNFKLLAIYSEVSKSVVYERLKAGGIRGCGPAVPALKAIDIEESPTIVAQMGPEPFLSAMSAVPDFDIVIGGRAYDPAPYVAYATFTAFGPVNALTKMRHDKALGGFTHMGKIMECGGVCAEPKSSGAVATIFSDGTFNIKPLNPTARCTPLSVAAHSLYEKTRPDILPGPGGNLDLTKSSYEQLQDGRTVQVRGGVFAFSRDNGSKYTVKLEGGKITGYRSMFIGSMTDPILIGQIDNFLGRVKEYVTQQHANASGKWEIGFHVYGKPSARPQQPKDKSMPESIFLVGEALASTQSLAASVASIARIACIHGPYKGQKATSGNFAFGIGGMMDIEAGPCTEFSIYHVMDLEDGEEEAAEIIPGQPETGSYDTDGSKKKDPLFSWNKVLISGKASQRPPAEQINRKVPPDSFAAPKYQPPPYASPGPLDWSKTSTLRDIASVIRSKNAGPFEITLDVMFTSISIYNTVKDSALLNSAVISGLYDLPEAEIIWCGFFDKALAFKATIPRKRNGKVVPSGGYLEDDVHGSQKYNPLANLVLPEQLIRTLKNITEETSS